MVEKTLWQRVKGAFFDEASTVQNEDQKTLLIHTEPIGSSGTESYWGYTREEYLDSLQGLDRAKEFDKLRRSDATVKMLLSAATNPIKGASWSVESESDDSNDKVVAEFCDHAILKDMDSPWTEKVSEILTFVPYGHSVFEVTYKAVLNHPVFGDYNGIKCMGFRSPKTIDRWNLDPKTGALLSISQQAYGDLQRLVDIPAQYLVIFTVDKEGDNFEGISMLRPVYGAWKRKNMYLKLMAIGQEKYAVSTPFLKVPEGKDNSQQFHNAVAVLKKYVTHQQQFLTIPAGWDIDFHNNQFDVSKTIEALRFENEEMVKAFMANFLLLGQAGGGGSYALSFDLSDFFLGGIEYLAKLICDEVNKSIIPQLVKMNFGPQKSYPKLKCSGIRDKVGKEFAEIINLLVQSKAIVADDKLEEDLRSRYKLPVKSTDGQRQSEPDPQSPNPQEPAKDKKVSFKEHCLWLLSEAPGLEVQAIQISKHLAMTLEDAKRIAMEFKLQTQRIEESDLAYRFIQKDPGLFIEGSLKALEPMDGVILFIGNPKPQMDPKIDSQLVMSEKRLADQKYRVINPNPECEYCQSRAGDIVSEGSEMPPFHDNCKCDVEPVEVGMSEKKKSKAQPKKGSRKS